MVVSNVQRALRHMERATALLSRELDEPIRKPEWFRDTGRLSDAGIAHMESLFDEGDTAYAVAKKMNMAYRAVALRKERWKKRRKKS